MDDAFYSPGHRQPPARERVEQPIAKLWSVVKGEHRRTANLHAHVLGFELRIVDEHGDFVFTQTRESEPDVVQVAAVHHDQYVAKGWTEINLRP